MRWRRSRQALGSFDRVQNIIRLEGVLNVAPGFTELPAVLNGASHLVSEVFRERGRHTRMIYANPNMPLDCRVPDHVLDGNFELIGSHTVGNAEKEEGRRGRRPSG